MSDVSALEYSTLKVPYEVLNKKFRTAQKTLDREVSHVVHTASLLDKLVQRDLVVVGDMRGVVSSLVEKLELVQQRVGRTVEDEREAAALLQARVRHLEQGVISENGGQSTTLDQWRRQRVDRLVVDFLLRAGLYETARTLAAQSDVLFMSNYDIFLSAKEVEETLERRQLDKCLDWVYDNKSKLRRLKSGLELAVRTQEFVELVRAGKRRQAVDYARKWFGTVDEQTTGWDDGRLRQAMGLLAVGPHTTIQEYRNLLADERWCDLIELFRAENVRLYQLSDQSVFSACFQSGLSVLKTPQCRPDGAAYEGGASTEGGASRRDCPVCTPDVHRLAEGLPYAHASHSRLVCAYDGQTLNEHNPPMMLPNGMVYGQRALDGLHTNDGRLVCPRTGAHFPLDQVQRVYVM